MNIVGQESQYLEQTSSIEQLINEIGPEIDREVDEIGELLQTLQERLVPFLFAADLTNCMQQEVIQQALNDCAHARAIQIRLATFISSIQVPNPNGEEHNSPGQTNTMRI